MTEIDSHAVKEQQRKDWGQAAANWKKNDERLRQVTAPVTERLLSLAGIAPGQRVLDIASGTGEPSLPAAEAVGPAGFVLATDMAPEMLAVAREKAEARGLKNMEFRFVDGEEIDVPPASFDAVTCRWGLMFMPEPVRCLRNAYAALKPGGRIAVSVWGPPERNPFFTVPMIVLRKYVDVPAPDPNAPGVFAFADRAKLQFVMEQAGFRDVRVEEMNVTMADFENGNEYWEYTREMTGPMRSLFEQLPPDKQEAVGREVAAAAAGGDANNPVSLAGLPLVASGVK